MSRRVMALTGIGALVLLLGVVPAAAVPQTTTTTAMCGRVAKAPTYKHVIVIVEENTSYSGIVRNTSAPYINSVISACGVARSYRNVTHHSLPNYLALTNGANLAGLKPFDGDCLPSSTCHVASNNIFSALSAKGKTWKAYDESMPTACGKSTSGYYAPRHNPVVYYTKISAATCKANDVPLGSTTSSPLLRALAYQSAPALSFVTPNLCHDMHGASGCPTNRTLTGDTWLKAWLPKITATADYKSGNTVVFIIWDEGSGGTQGEDCASNGTDQSCHVPAIVVAPSVRARTVATATFTHYSLLRTIETMLGVTALGRSATAPSMVSAFNL